ncbi:MULTISPECIES: hypothetical protein [unclassified Marinobacter]|jgi:hypothetical protein|uniref:hypothetical protein n=1 Tax=unclassified Marinobacter TaxID=83889 RepID=UPI00200C1BC9|nr:MULTISPECIES: hypothetical protein [unclassified Marinobacter]UQG57787.1 hypothetical protein MIH16_09190 [Marinobacter sp. M4C]UQG66592.1 hypothetical protein MIH17_09190 [Marinobacter sp. M2C]UQG70872.1 hypothetical protein MIH19_09185 [Marinobacter sp. M1C]
MNKFFILALMSILPLSLSASGSDLRIVYGKLEFYIPNNPNLVGYLGTDSEILIAKYSDEPGKDIVGFSLDKEVNTGGCSPGVFFKSVLSKNKSECDVKAIDSFRYVFMKDRESGIWSSTNKEFFYFIGSDKSTVFLIKKGTNNKTYKIESNFLNKEGIKDIFSSYL